MKKFAEKQKGKENECKYENDILEASNHKKEKLKKSTDNSISQCNWNKTIFQTAQDNNSKIEGGKDLQDGRVYSSLTETGTRVPALYPMNQVLNEPTVSTKQITQRQWLRRNDHLLLPLGSSCLLSDVGCGDCLSSMSRCNSLYWVGLMAFLHVFLLEARGGGQRKAFHGNDEAQETNLFSVCIWITSPPFSLPLPLPSLLQLFFFWRLWKHWEDFEFLFI